MPEFSLPPLPYDYGALEPTIDTQTMQIHHDKHHAAYVNNLNAAVKDHPNLPGNVEELLRGINSVPEAIRTAVRNNGGGHANHTMFWEIMKPGGSKQPDGHDEGRALSSLRSCAAGTSLFRLLCVPFVAFVSSC